MDTIVKLVEILVWPVTVVVLLYLLRKDLSGLLSRLASLKYKDVEAIFRDELRQAEAQAEHIRTGETQAEPTAPPKTIYEQLLRVADISPRAAIAEAWRYVEAAAVKATQTAGLELPGALPVNHLVRHLVQAGLFSDNAVVLFDRLRRLRNEAVHSSDFALDQDEAQRYINLALRLEQELFHAGNALGIARGKVIITPENHQQRTEGDN